MLSDNYSPIVLVSSDASVSSDISWDFEQAGDLQVTATRTSDDASATPTWSLSQDPATGVWTITVENPWGAGVEAQYEITRSTSRTQEFQAASGEIDQSALEGALDHIVRSIQEIDEKTPSSGGSGGDMLKSVYDTDNDGIVDKAESVDDGTNSATAAEVADAVSKAHTAGAEMMSGDVSGVVSANTVDKIKGTPVDPTDIADGKVLKYNATTGNLEYADDNDSGGDMTKAVYDIDDDGIVDAAESINDGTNSATAADIADAVAKKHAQDTDQYLDQGGANQVSAAEAKTAYDHSQVTSGNPHNVTKDDVGLGNVENINHNLSATADPTATDDADAGYSIGSRWVNTMDDKHWVCVDDTAGAAVWHQTDASGSGGGTVQGTDGNTYNIRAADEGAVAGNARGEYSVDFQTVRSSASQVASGEYAFLGPGYRCKVSGARGTCLGGYQCNVNEQGATSIGADNAGLNHRSSVALGSRYGSSQIEGHVIYGRSGTVATYYGGHGGMFTLGRQTTDATQTELVSSTGERFVLENNQTIGFRIVVLARQIGGSSGTVGDSFRWVYEGLIKRGADASATTLVDATQQYAGGNAGASGWSVSIEADTTNGALVIKVTGEADKTVNWMANVFIERLVGS